MESTMRLYLGIIFLMNILIAKDMNYKIQNFTNQGRVVSLNNGMYHDATLTINTITREDTTTIYLEDFEGDISGWTSDSEWELTDESSYSPTQSFHLDDDNYDVISSLTSPVLSVPSLISDNEIIKMNFALWADLPDYDGDGDNYLEDYYWVDIANVSDVPVYFNQSSSDSYDGQNESLQGFWSHTNVQSELVPANFSDTVSDDKSILSLLVAIGIRFIRTFYSNTYIVRLFFG